MIVSSRDDLARHGEGGRTEEERRELQPAPDGVGPLVQRDYVVVIADSACTPEDVLEKIRTDFPRFSPEELARFSRPADATGPLAVDDTMNVWIRGFGDAGVRVTALDPQSLTLGTLEGHPEAGRITFGAQLDESGRLVCRIRSRARLRDTPMLSGYRLVGKYHQGRVWVTFLERLADACGGRVLGEVLTAADEVAELPEDRPPGSAPTFVTRRQ